VPATFPFRTTSTANTHPLSLSTQKTDCGNDTSLRLYVSLVAVSRAAMVDPSSTPAWLAVTRIREPSLGGRIALRVASNLSWLPSGQT
jgi:hypothetical protein